MYRILALLTLALSFSAAHGATKSEAEVVADALVNLVKGGATTELNTFANHISDVTSADVQEHSNGDATILIKGPNISNDTLCGHAELTIERTTVHQFFGPVTVYRGKTTFQQKCP